MKRKRKPLISLGLSITLVNIHTLAIIRGFFFPQTFCLTTLVIIASFRNISCIKKTLFVFQKSRKMNMATKKKKKMSIFPSGVQCRKIVFDKTSAWNNIFGDTSRFIFSILPVFRRLRHYNSAHFTIVKLVRILQKPLIKTPRSPRERLSNVIV